MHNNAESFENLEKNLSFVGIDIDKLPLVLQFNKRDLKDIISEEDLNETWGKTGLPVFMASALYGNGVVETFSSLAGITYDYIDAKIGLDALHGLSREAFLDHLIRLNASASEG
jgi:signal recognition particle receptor subunit beta